MPELADIDDKQHRSRGVSLVVSVLVHGLFFVALLSIAPDIIPDAEDQTERPIKVDFIPIAQLQPKPAPPPPTSDSETALAVSAPEEPEEPQEPRAPQAARRPYDAPRPMVKATRLLSASLLADPGNAEGRKEFYGLAEDEQQDQLCALEALEQIRAWNPRYVPERMVSYTFEEVRYEGNRLIADGAAFWSKENWHRLKFDCLLSEDRKSVVDFSFLVGVIVPKDQWEDHDLTRYK